MKKILLSLTILISTVTLAQKTAQSKYTFGFGVNFIDNTGGVSKNKFFEIEDWNVIPFVSAFTVERKMAKNFSLNAQFLLNDFEKNKFENGRMITRNVTYASASLNALYTFDSHIVDVKWFDASVIAGLGTIWFDGIPTQNFNAGLAFDFWFSKNVALRLETQGKIVFSDKVLSDNHIVHSASIILPIR